MQMINFVRDNKKRPTGRLIFVFCGFFWYNGSSILGVLIGEYERYTSFTFWCVTAD